MALTEGLRPAAGRAAEAVWRHLVGVFGGPARTRVILLLAAILALNSADTATVGASATQLREALRISNTDIGLLVAVTAIVAAIASVPFGMLTDRLRRTRILSFAIVLWGVAMVASATAGSFNSLLLYRVFLGAVTAAAGPAVASLVGDYFPSAERGRIYSFILSGELLGAGIGFVITGDVASLSWRAAFVVLALPAFGLAWLVHRLPEPARGGASELLPGATHIVDTRDVTSQARPASPEDDTVEDTTLKETDAQRVAADHGVTPDETLVLHRDARRMGLLSAVRYVLRVRTNVILIVSSAFGYYFLAGVQTFGVEFVKDQYRIGQALANLLLLAIGGGALLGILTGGRVGDFLLRRRYLNGRILVAGVAALATVVLFIPALITRSSFTALPYFIGAAFFLSAQNPPIDAARLDIMPPLLWGRAEGVRTFLRTAAQALAPLIFGAVSDLLGGGRMGLQYTFIFMLLPLCASGVVLLRGLRTYPRDVATAAASASAEP
ncbi:MAG: MFS transporter [Actinobacteria bacterium]|nr:MAG: MFS transporter [Actinomycetota bacterium]